MFHRSTKPLKRTPLRKGKPITRKRGLSSKKPKPKKKKKLTDGQLKKRVWTQFSIYIRLRGADAEGFNRCVTCGERFHWKQLQAGHFIRGRLNANLFDERGCNPQCHRCNIHFQGNVVMYYRWMEAKYGKTVIDDLIRQNEITKKWLPGELQGMLEYYKNLNELAFKWSEASPLVREHV